jgi:hypothetical protein
MVSHGPTDAPSSWPLDHVPRGVILALSEVMIDLDKAEYRPRNRIMDVSAHLFDDVPEYQFRKAFKGVLAHQQSLQGGGRSKRGFQSRRAS